MFSWQHFVWLGICVVMILVVLRAYQKKRPSLSSVLNSALVVCAFSEISKVFSTIEMVPSANGTIVYPYIPMNHLPFHLCSIHILLILYVRFTSNLKMRENVLAFMYPTGVFGSILALLMPSIFTTSITVNQAFTSLISYQFFIFHSMLIALGIIIVKSGEVEWGKQHIYNALIIIFILAFLSIYVNSLLASPTYVDGKLVSVDFWPNFFFTYQNPLGIKITEKWQWLTYLGIISVLAVIIVYGSYYPFVFRKKKK